MGTAKSRWQTGGGCGPERQQDGQNRRAFLIGTGAALVGVAAGGNAKAAATTPEAAAGDRTTLSYRETDHVHRFYACARF